MNFHLKKLENKSETIPETTGKNKMIKIWTESNEGESENRCWFFEKMNKIEETLLRLTKKEKGHKQPKPSERWDITLIRQKLKGS